MTNKAFFEEVVLTPDVYRSTPFQYDLTAIPSQKTQTFGHSILFGRQWNGMMGNQAPRPEPKAVRDTIPPKPLEEFIRRSISIFPSRSSLTRPGSGKLKFPCG